MHKSLSVTDGVYGVLSDADVRDQIAGLGKSATGNLDKNDLVASLKRLLDQLKNSAKE